MAGISSLGIGSGLDLSGLVKKLLDAERAPVQNTLDRQQSRFTSELSGIGIFRGAIASFRSSLSGLSSFENYSTRTYSNPKSSALAVSVNNDAAVGSYQMDIKNLAQKHAVASAAFNSPNEIIGSGNLQIKFGTITGPGFTTFTPDSTRSIQNITVDSSNNTLTGLKDYINNGDYGVTAAIINDGTGYRLTLQSQNTGANAAMEITVTDTGDMNNTDTLGLSRLAYNAAATNLTETQAAQDATVIINGITIHSASNVLDKTIQGVNLTLQDKTAGSPFTLTVSKNTASASDAIHKVVKAYNKMMKTLNDLSKPGINGKKAGILVSDSSLRGFTDSIRGLLTGRVKGLNGHVTALSTIGIKTQSDGTLSIDDSVLSKALEQNPTDSLALLAQVGTATDPNISFKSFSDNTVAGRYDINVTQMATQSVLSGATGLTMPLTIDNTNDNLSFFIDGVSTGALSLTQGNYAGGADIAAEIQSRINTASAIKTAGLSVTVKYDTATKGLVITSDQFGSSSKVEITTIDTNTTRDLGLSIGAATAGQDVAGTIGGLAATGKGKILTGSAGNADGLSLEINDGGIGSRGSVRFTRGLVESMNKLIGSYLDSSGILSSKENGLNSSLDKIKQERVALDERLKVLQASYVKQFTALDALISRFQSTGNFIAQQISGLPGSGQPNKK